MIFYKIITEQVMKEDDMRILLEVLKDRGINALFDGFEHVKPK